MMMPARMRSLMTIQKIPMMMNLARRKLTFVNRKALHAHVNILDEKRSKRTKNSRQKQLRICFFYPDCLPPREVGGHKVTRCKHLLVGQVKQGASVILTNRQMQQY